MFLTVFASLSQQFNVYPIFIVWNNGAKLFALITTAFTRVTVALNFANSIIIFMIYFMKTLQSHNFKEIIFLLGIVPFCGCWSRGHECG